MVSHLIRCIAITLWIFKIYDSFKCLYKKSIKTYWMYHVYIYIYIYIRQNFDDAKTALVFSVYMSKLQEYMSPLWTLQVRVCNYVIHVNEFTRIEKRLYMFLAINVITYTRKGKNGYVRQYTETYTAHIKVVRILI